MRNKRLEKIEQDLFLLKEFVSQLSIAVRDLAPENEDGPEDQGEVSPTELEVHPSLLFPIVKSMITRETEQDEERMFR